MDTSVFNTIIAQSLRPLMLLTFGLAIAALITGIASKKRWIPLLCGIGALALIFLQLIRPTSVLYSTIGSYGMGKPEVVAQVTLAFLSIAFFSPFYSLITLLGLLFAFVKKTSHRFSLLALCWMVFLGFNAFMIFHFDTGLSLSLADGRGDREEELLAMQERAYIQTMEESGSPLTDEEKGTLYKELYLPRSVDTEIFREDFFKIHKPASMLTALLRGNMDEALQKNSEMLDQVVTEAHQEACIEHGKELAQQKLQDSKQR